MYFTQKDRSPTGLSHIHLHKIYHKRFTREVLTREGQKKEEYSLAYPKKSYYNIFSSLNWDKTSKMTQLFYGGRFIEK